MEEIKVGEYVRTKKGKIRQVQTIHSGERITAVTKETLINGKIKIPDVLKHSFNIIDLIEVGDFVNEKKITCITSYQGEKELVYEENTGGGICCYIRLKDIKSIVTKEMFLNAEYRVEAN